MDPQLSRRSFSWPLAALLLAGASNGLFGQMLYVGNYGDDTISAYVIDQTSGLLTEVLPRVSSTGAPTAVAVHPNTHWVYVTNAGNAALGANGPSLAQFSIDPGTGALTLANTVPLIPGSGPVSVAIDPTGSFALVAHQGANYVSVYSLDPISGNATAVAGSPFAAPQGSNSVVVHPNGKFVYVSGAGAGQIAGFNLDPSSGSLTPVAGSPFAGRSNLYSMAMDPAGRFLFAIERQDNAVLVYSIDPASGALTLVGPPVGAGPGVAGVAVDPAGQFLYVTTFGNAAVTSFSIDPSGALTRLKTVGSIVGAFGAILDPSGQFLYIPGQQANAVAGFSVDESSGAVSPLPQQFFPAGASPERGATVLLSPPILPPIGTTAAFNFHSHALPGMPDAGMAQGSKLGITGQNIGPAVGVSATFPLQTVLGGASVQIQSGDVTTAGLMVFASNNLVTAVVPSTTPLGPATVTVSYNGQTSTPLPITIVATSFGIRTLGGSGSGPAKAWAATPDTVLQPDPSILQIPNSLAQPAQPGQFLIVQGTGLGAVTFDETQNLNQELSIPVNAVIGNETVPAVFELRVSEGSDYIAFQLPADVLLGCYVPIAIQAGGVTSNVASVSISSDGGPCSDPAGFSASDISAAQKAGQINMGTVVLSHIDLGPYGASDGADGIFVRYNFNALQQAFSPGNNGAGIRSSFATPPLGSCTVTAGVATDPNHPFNLSSDQTLLQYLNAGSALNLNGPPGTVQLPAPDYSFNPKDSAIVPGDYTVDNGTGSAAIGAFQAVLTVPAPLTWTNQAAITGIDRTQDLTVTWSGGNPDTEFALIVGLAASSQVTAGFLCAESVSAGQFTVPAWVLSSLPPSETFSGVGQTMPGGLVGVGTASFTNTGRFTATGLDFALFTYEQALISVLLYQ